jgi:hypothetical protein
MNYLPKFGKGAQILSMLCQYVGCFLLIGLPSHGV